MFSIHSPYTDKRFTDLFREHFSSDSHETFQQAGCTLLKFPFSCSTFSDFIDIQDNADFKDRKELLDTVEKQLRKLPFQRKRNDLFDFNQSVDIVNFEIDKTNSEAVSLLTAFRHFLLSDVLPWLQNLTGTQLEENKVDLTSSIYGKSDVLLCHDDELEGRRIAFIWYLVPEDWDAAKDGGYLQLFSCETPDQPKYHPDPFHPAARVNPWHLSALLPPHRNMFAFFEVSAYSFHQVTEILTDKERVSLHGWFHGPPLPRPAERDHPTPIQRITPTHIEEELVYRWLNPMYIDMAQQAKIRRRFVRASEIQLVNFLKTDRWEELTKALVSLNDEKIWSQIGPYNRKNFRSLTRDSAGGYNDLPDILRQFYRLFASEAMLVILSDLTGIPLHPSSAMMNGKASNANAENLEPEPKKSRTEEASTSTDSLHEAECAVLTDLQVRRWTPGCYTLLADTELVGGNWRLEAVLHLIGYGKPKPKSTQLSNVAHNKSDSLPACWDPSWGGQIVYVAKDEVDNLLTVQPVDNALTLVYVGPDTTSFVQYIKHVAKSIPNGASNENDQNYSGSAMVCAYDLAVTYYEPRTDGQSENEQSSVQESDSSAVSDEDDDDNGDDDEEEEVVEDEDEVSEDNDQSMNNINNSNGDTNVDENVS